MATELRRWGGQNCGMKAPLIIIHASPLVHMNSRSIRKNKNLNSVTKGKEMGCIQEVLDANKQLSFFDADIISPNADTSVANLKAHDTLMNVVKPLYNCSGSSDAFINTTEKMWTMKDLFEF